MHTGWRWLRRLTLVWPLAVPVGSFAALPAADHTLPLASHWSVGLYPGGFDPAYQVGEIERGHHLLPWLFLPRPDHRDGRVDAGYYTPFQEMAKRRLAISFVSTQWDALVIESLCRTRPAGGAAGTRAAGAVTDAVRASTDSICDGPAPALSPFSPMTAWYEAGRTWGGLPILRQLEALYPDPPLVIFLSNNEQPKLTWTQLRGAPADDAALRRRIGDAWTLRYRELQRGFRDGLESENWRRAARFVGYDAIGPAALGRWPGWIEYSLQTPGRLDPWHLALDGASASYYVGDWDASTDFRVWSPQIEAMNWLPMVGEARRHDPGYWLELSVWDGQQPGGPRDKPTLYRGLGQSYDSARYGGMVQFGMWLLRPQVVREFRDHLATRARFGDYFAAVMQDVDRVYAEPDLARFWREGRLLENHATSHPYQSAVPADMADARWFLLDCDANPPRPWTLDTPLRVFALALEVGQSPGREWLVYGFAPLGATSARVHIPGGPAARVDAVPAGSFTLLHETPDAAP